MDIRVRVRYIVWSRVRGAIRFDVRISQMEFRVRVRYSIWSRVKVATSGLMLGRLGWRLGLGTSFSLR